MVQFGPVTLRPVEERDLPFLQVLLNDPDIASSVVDYGLPVSSLQQREWFEKKYPLESAWRFMIDAEGATVGSIVFGKIARENCTGELGFKIARAYQGKSYAHHAICAMLSFLFSEKDMECVVTYHLASNLSSRRVIEKAGFRYEGVARSAVYRNGRRQDLVYWSCSKEYYKKTEGI